MSDKPKDPKLPSGPILVGNYRITVDRDLCIGAATCMAMAPKTFGLDEDSKAIILETAGGDTDEQVLEAAKSCPTVAIIIETTDGKRVFPK